MEYTMTLLQAIKAAKTLSQHFMVRYYVIRADIGQYDVRSDNVAVILYGPNPNYVTSAFGGSLDPIPQGDSHV